MTGKTQNPFGEQVPRLAGVPLSGGKNVWRKCSFNVPLPPATEIEAQVRVFCDFQAFAKLSNMSTLRGAAVHTSLEAAKKTVRDFNETAPQRLEERRRKASPRAVALLERWKDLPSVDPHLLRVDNERLLDSSP
jgi:hypothetical protein